MASTIIYTTIIGFSLVLILFAQRFHLLKNRFKNKKSKLATVFDLKKEQQIHLNQKVKLSEDFNKTYKKSQSEINQLIYDANFELFKNTDNQNKRQ